jgi:hypothetical protein
MRAAAAFVQAHTDVGDPVIATPVLPVAGPLENDVAIYLHGRPVLIAPMKNDRVTVPANVTIDPTLPVAVVGVAARGQRFSARLPGRKIIARRFWPGFVGVFATIYGPATTGR